MPRRRGCARRKAGDRGAEVSRGRSRWAGSRPKARTLEVASRTRVLVLAKRQNNQLELAFGSGVTGEARSALAEGTEADPASPRPQSPAASEPCMATIVERDNLRKALAQVRRNKGAPGVDGMTVDDLPLYLKEHWPSIRNQLLDGTYRPQPVRRVEIPKAGGGTRALGIPTVLDRFIQQAVLQVLQAHWDPTFAAASYGFRPGRSAHRAVARAQAHIADGYGWVVDLDLEKFFDRVNHDILMGLVAERVADRGIRRLVRGFLSAGVLVDGLVGPTDEGTPQGGPLSPLLSNLMLDVLDRELTRRGHRFVRYADDCNIYVRSRRAGERVLTSVTGFVARRLRLRVNAAKSAVDRPSRRTFLGFSFTAGKAPRRRGRGVPAAPRGTAHRARGAVPARGAGPGADAADQGELARADDRSAAHLPRRVGGLLRLLPDAVGVAPLAPVASTTAACLRVEAMAPWPEPVRAVDPSGRAASARGPNRGQRARPLADRRQSGSQHRALERRSRRARPSRHDARSRVIQRTAVVRTRMPGGVGGGSRKASPYPDRSNGGQ